MPETKPNDRCKYCGGRIYEEDTFSHDLSRRYAHYRCESCNKTTRVSVEKAVREVYPQIQHISMEVEREGERGARRYDDDSISDWMFICDNQKCTNPGITMESLLHQMIEERKTHDNFYRPCDGFEPSPKWRRKKPCDQVFRITVDIEFK